ncbi:hypothetical protein FRC04_009044 [Tulasnella sp. 424]|nr:hypothetical protein FRC04_009044 [Tulasnella sp. 424]
MTAVLRYCSIPPPLLFGYDSRPNDATKFTSSIMPEHWVAHDDFSQQPHPLSRSVYYDRSVNSVTPDQPGTPFANQNGYESFGSGPEQPRRFSYPLDRPTIDLAESSGLLSTQSQRALPVRRLSTPHSAARRRAAAVPSPIGTPVSAVNHSFRFKPVIENDHEEPQIRTRQVGRAGLSSRSRTSSLGPQVASASSPPSQRPRPHARLSIFLAPPLQGADSNDNTSPPPTPILAVLEEGYNHCLRAVLKQDALVAAVNYTRHLRIPSSRLHYLEGEPRSHGAYGDVWYGQLDDGSGDFRTVAIKRIRLGSQDGESNYGLLKSLLGEVVPWYRLNHPNISPFIGYTFDNGHATLVSEWQHHGHVMKYLQGHPHANRLELIAQAAEALAYLHEQSSPLVHGDIKPENVLVSHEGIIKLTDFGISTVLHQHPTSDLQTSHSFRGTLRYADPALLGENPKPTTFTDLWAFGWLIFGILTERRPYAHIQSELRVPLAIMKYEVPRSSNYSDLPHGDLIWPILTACWSRSTAQRWPASCIARHIRQSKLNVHLASVSPE